jgi:plasmid maintenance system antidote protein VapI
LPLSRYLGPSAAFWLNLQGQYDLARAEKLHGEQIRAKVEPA